jgi:hypothetical protein
MLVRFGYYYHPVVDDLPLLPNSEDLDRLILSKRLKIMSSTHPQEVQNLTSNGTERPPSPAERVRDVALNLILDEVNSARMASMSNRGSSNDGTIANSGRADSLAVTDRHDHPEDAVVPAYYPERLRSISDDNGRRIAASLSGYAAQGLELLSNNTLGFSDPFASLTNVNNSSFLRSMVQRSQSSTDSRVAPGATDNGAVVAPPQVAPMTMAMSMPLGDSSAMVQSPVTDNGVAPFHVVADRVGPPADRQREINPSIDNPQAVQRRYTEHLDGLVRSGNLTRAQADHMQQTFQQSMDAMAGTDGQPGLYTAEQMQEISRSMNTVLDNSGDGRRLSALQGANTLVDLAAQGRDSRDGQNSDNAFGQGAHNTCAGTSHNRLLGQRNFVEYSNRIASVAEHGGAYVGGQNGQPRQWVSVNAANFRGDRESNRPWNADNMLRGGQRGMATLLGNALEGQAQADLATERDRRVVNPDLGRTLNANERYEYVTANAGALGAVTGQSQTGEGLFLTNTQTGIRQFMGGFPPATLDIVAARNHADGLGGIFVHENFRAGLPGNHPGINWYRDAADLRQQLSRTPGVEHQIATNGTIVAGRQGHGLHAQTVRFEAGQNIDGGQGRLLFGNNWTAQNNNREYHDNGSGIAVNTFTNPQAWNGFRPQHTLPDSNGGGGRVPDWQHERMSPDGHRNNPNNAEHEQHNQERRPQERRSQVDSLDSLNRMMTALSEWYSNLNAATARGQASRQEFLASNVRPELSRFSN